MGLDALLDLDAELLVQFGVYMLIAFAFGCVLSAFVVQKFHERDMERYRDGISEYERIKPELQEAKAETATLQTELQKAKAEIEMLQKKLEDADAEIEQLRTFPRNNRSDPGFADKALFDVLSGQSV